MPPARWHRPDWVKPFARGVTTAPEDSDYSPDWKWVAEEELEGTPVEFQASQHREWREGRVELDTAKRGRVSVWVDPSNPVAKLKAERAGRKNMHGEPLVGAPWQDADMPAGGVRAAVDPRHGKCTHRSSSCL